MDGLITLQEIELFRTPPEFITWFDEYLEKTRLDQRYKKEILLHEGIAKVVYEEVFPLYRFLQVFGGVWSDLRFRNVIGNQNYDVEIQGGAPLPFRFLEISVADMNHEENLRMQYFLEHGSVPAIGQVTFTGNKRKGMNIEVSNDARQHTEVNNEKKVGIRTSIEQKSSMNYPAETALLIYFDDYVAFSDDGDNQDTLEFIDDLEAEWESVFSKIYFVGASGRRGWTKLKGEQASSANLQYSRARTEDS